MYRSRKTSLMPSDVIVRGLVRGALGIEPVEKQISPFPFDALRLLRVQGMGFRPIYRRLLSGGQNRR